MAEVTFRKSGASAAWDGSAESLLELAENAGLTPEFSCRAGICNSCKCGLLSGEVRDGSTVVVDRDDEGAGLILR